MSKTALKMLGMALMAVSIFMILFGIYVPAGSETIAGTVVTWLGVVLLFVGFVLFAIIRND